MSVNPNKLIITTLALSGLVHGGLFVYQADSFIYGEPVSSDSYISVSLQPSSSQKNDPVKNTDTNKKQQKKVFNASSENRPGRKGDTLKAINSSAGDGLKSRDEMQEKSVLQVDRLNETDILDVIEQGAKMLSGEDRDFLLGLLHDEISVHKKYPFMAVRQRREGLVTINFSLHPDGHISNISVVKSSRYDLLDNAARLAVEKISPFQVAGNYLHQTELFNVDIDFRLN